MRKITAAAVSAFYNGRPFSQGNTRVDLHHDAVELSLHGTAIARLNLNSGQISIRHAGWTTATTKDRLNGILDRIGGRIHQKDFEWYLDGRRWDGGCSWTTVS